MKILCCIDFISSGGAERQLVALAIILKQIGYEVKVLVTHHKPFHLSQLKKNAIPYLYLQAENKLTRIPKVVKAIKANKPDVVIAYMRNMGIMGVCARLLGQRFKLIVSERGVSINNLNTRLTFEDNLKFFLYRWSDFIVCNSCTQTEFIKKSYPILESKLKTIPNFIDLDQFCPKFLKSFKNTNLRIIVPARVSEEKNILNLLLSIKILSKLSYSFKIYWFGSQENSIFYNKCILNVNELNLTDYISFYPPTDQIEKEYQKADLLCLPSLTEGYPNVICEAMASGLPVLCSDVSDNSKIVEEGLNGFLFDPTSPKDIARAFEKFLSLSSEEKMKMGEASRMLAEQKFSKEEFLKSYNSLIIK